MEKRLRTGGYIYQVYVYFCNPVCFFLTILVAFCVEGCLGRPAGAGGAEGEAAGVQPCSAGRHHARD